MLSTPLVAQTEIICTHTCKHTCIRTYHFFTSHFVVFLVLSPYQVNEPEDFSKES